MTGATSDAGPTRRSYLEHVRLVRRFAAWSSLDEALAFAAACVERMFPVYARAVAGRAWDRTAAYRTSLDLVWRQVDDGHGAPPALASEWEGRTEGEGLIADGLVTDDADLAANDAALSLHVLLLIASRTAPRKDLSGIAQANLALIDGFLQDQLGVADARVDEHELMTAEVRRQTEDMEALGGHGWSLRRLVARRSKQRLPPTFVHDARRVRQGSAGCGILGSAWFPA